MTRLHSLAAVAVAALAAAGGGLRADRQRSAADAAERVEADARVRDLDIRFYESRVYSDSTGARDRMQLGALHLQRARTTGSNDDLLRAERWAKQSLALRRTRNGAALVVLASALLAQHRFAEALEAAGQLVELDPGRGSYRALYGEVALELGRYPEADSVFAALSGTGDALSLGPRLARWAELRGRPEDARRWLEAALAAASTRAAVPPEQLAWLHLRLGEISMRNGAGSAAGRHFREGLAIDGEDHRVLAALARLEYSRRHWARAIELGERALAATLEPATLGLLADASAAAGDTARAAGYERAMAAAIGSQAGAYHRAWSLFELDHGADPDPVLTRARAELEQRKDVYGYDLLAWALYRAGRFDEAAEPMRRALAQGTRDASLHFHAGMIARARGDAGGASAHLRRALEVNPGFDPRQADAARAVLDSIAGDR